MVDLIIGYIMDFARWLIVLTLAFIYPETYTSWNGKVVEVVRGDEIKVERAGKVENVRLYGIDAPIWWGTKSESSGGKKQDPKGELKSEEKSSTPRRFAPQEFGDKTKRYLEQRALGKAVTVQPLPSRIKGPWYRPKVVMYDQYDRIIGLVHMYNEKGRSLNEELLEKGLAWWYRPFVPFERGYKHLQDLAQEQGVGIWSKKGAAPPWEWQGTQIDKLNPLQRGVPETPAKP